jgi:hypothetical protein
MMVAIAKCEKKNESKRFYSCLVLIEGKKKNKYDWRYSKKIK